MGIENQINKETMDKINKIIGKAEENFINRTWRIDIPTSEIVLLNEKGLKDLSNYNAVYAQIFEQISTQFLNNGFCHKNPFVHYSLVHNKAVIYEGRIRRNPTRGLKSQIDKINKGDIDLNEAIESFSERLAQLLKISCEAEND